MGNKSNVNDTETSGLSTYSIVGSDPEAGECGVAVQSKFLAVGAFVPWAAGGIGAVAVQAYPDITHGRHILDLLEDGLSPEAALEAILADDELRDNRQIGVVSAEGESSSFTGDACFEHARSVTGPGFAAQGNILSSPAVADAMAETFTAESGPLAERLLSALEAAQAAGGEKRGMESAAMVVVRPNGGYGGNHDRWLDLRVDHSDQPIAGLRRLFELHTLYFGQSSPEDLLALDEGLATEVESILRAIHWWDADSSLEDNLFSWMGWHNLEERRAPSGQIDPLVWRELRKSKKERT